jgi:hypothetical protein
MRFAGDSLLNAGVGGGFDTSNLAGKMGMKTGGDIASITISPNGSGGFTRFDRNDGDNNIYYAPDSDSPYVRTPIGSGNRDVAYPEGEGIGVSLTNARQNATERYVKDGQEVSAVKDPIAARYPEKGLQTEDRLKDYREEKRRSSFLKGTNVYDQSADDFASDLGEYGEDIDGSVLERIQAMRGR